MCSSTKLFDRFGTILISIYLSLIESERADGRILFSLRNPSPPDWIRRASPVLPVKPSRVGGLIEFQFVFIHLISFHEKTFSIWSMTTWREEAKGRLVRKNENNRLSREMQHRPSAVEACSPVASNPTLPFYLLEIYRTDSAVENSSSIRTSVEPDQAVAEEVQ